MLKLNRENLSTINSNPSLVFPTAEQLVYPERIIQFGTGVLLRGLPDFYVDEANRIGQFKGRIVVIKSTSSGDTSAFSEQDGLYTISIKGISSGETVQKSVINSSISRVLVAQHNWTDILNCAENLEIQLVISNTTEVGIAYVEEKIGTNAPISYPGKLLAYLLRRYDFFKGSPSAGLVIIPTELIPHNADKLLEILIRLAEFNECSFEFIEWVKSSNYFCNSLVDRIVPGMLSAEQKLAAEKSLGYTDHLMIMAEPFNLWAIESASEYVKSILSFAQSSPGCVVVPSIEKFKELKLRILNGSHTFSCSLAILHGNDLVRNSMKDPLMSSFISSLMFDEIVPALVSSSIPYEDALAFASNVKDRFSNPFIDHKWSSISVQMSSKMKMRNVPLIKMHYQKTNSAPSSMCLGFAAFLLFMRSEKNGAGQYVGKYKQYTYQITDDNANYFSNLWNENQPEELVALCLADQSFWGDDLSQYDGFSSAVLMHLNNLLNQE
jgi:tagaturonate reductase